jgi:ubiquinol-cytochrome c reductase cytochrome c1 subunit
MKKSIILAGVLALLAGPVLAAGETPTPPKERWSFSGPFGTFDRAQIQRGFKIFREVCSNCHSLKLVAFRMLAQPGGPEFSPKQIEALAAEYKVKDGPNESGDMFERPGRPISPSWPRPAPTSAASRGS